jgi:hypothetical protein
VSGIFVVWRVFFMAGFLEVVLQLFFCLAAALANGTQLLRRWGRAACWRHDPADSRLRFRSYWKSSH